MLARLKQMGCARSRPQPGKPRPDLPFYFESIFRRATPADGLSPARRPYRSRNGYVTQIALGFAQGYQKDRIYPFAPQMIEKIPSVQLEPQPWYNPDLRSRWFFIPGIIGSLTLVLVVTLTAFAVVREREIGTLEQIMVTPIRPAEFILGKTLPFFLIGLFDVSLIATV